MKRSNQENHNAEPAIKMEWKALIELTILALILIVYMIQFGFWHVMIAIYLASFIMMGTIVTVGMLKERGSK